MDSDLALRGLVAPNDGGRWRNGHPDAGDERRWVASRYVGSERSWP